MKKQILILIFAITSFIGFSQTPIFKLSHTSNSVGYNMSQTVTTYTVPLSENIFISNILPTITYHGFDSISVVINTSAGMQVIYNKGHDSIVFNAASIGTYTCFIILYQGATANSYTNFNINVVPGTITGVSNLTHDNNSKLSVFPNPAIDEVTVLFNANKEKTNIEVFDIQGRLVYVDTDDREIGKNKIKLNTSNFSAGIYIVRAGSETFKITKI
jgi:hypothetical protein